MKQKVVPCEWCGVDRRYQPCKEDVISVASALIEDAVNFSCGDYGEYYWCAYCTGQFEKLKDFKHDLNCVVLKAKDLLAGVE